METGSSQRGRRTFREMSIPHSQLVKAHIGRWFIENGAPQGSRPEDFFTFIDQVGIHVIYAHQALVLATLLEGGSLKDTPDLLRTRLGHAKGQT